MKTIVIGQNCIELDEVDSTNRYLASLTPGPSPKTTGLAAKVGGAARGKQEVFEGTVVIARSQSAGRGQRGSIWESEPYKNLIISILLTPTFLALKEQFELNKAISLAVNDFVGKCLGPLCKGESGERGLCKIKWPNDIYIGSKKVAGILIENTVSGNQLQQSIVGIGLNVNQEKFSASLPNPTSLKLETGKDLDLKECLEELCSCIEKRYLQLRNRSAQIDKDYLASLYRFEEWGNYKVANQMLEARIIGVSKAGKLRLEKRSGEKLECDLKEVEFS